MMPKRGVPVGRNDGSLKMKLSAISHSVNNYTNIVPAKIKLYETVCKPNSVGGRDRQVSLPGLDVLSVLHGHGGYTVQRDR